MELVGAIHVDRSVDSSVPRCVLTLVTHSGATHVLYSRCERVYWSDKPGTHRRSRHQQQRNTHGRLGSIRKQPASPVRTSFRCRRSACLTSVLQCFVNELHVRRVWCARLHRAVGGQQPPKRFRPVRNHNQDDFGISFVYSHLTQIP